ncbi:MAG: ATP-binding protein, partial [Mariniphaga sp.]
RNLTSNAVKFTPKHGKIQITSKMLHENLVEISVRDTGIGMDQNLRDKLFVINEQINRKGTDGELSTGLGLIICRDFIEKHGGSLGVESEEGRGSCFYFTVPAVKPSVC